MIRLRLRKPLYRLRTDVEPPYPWMMYELRPDVHEWLAEREPTYDLDLTTEYGKGDKANQKFLYCWLELMDHNVATLFKLTWM